MRSCYLSVSCPGAWLGMQLSLPKAPAPPNDSAGSTVLVWVPTSYSDRALQSHTHRHTCLIGYFARPGPTAMFSTDSVHAALEHMLGQI